MQNMKYQNTEVVKELTEVKEVVTGTFYEQQIQKTNCNIFMAEKVQKKKSDKSYIKCRDQNNTFKSNNAYIIHIKYI